MTDTLLERIADLEAEAARLHAIAIGLASVPYASGELGMCNERILQASGELSDLSERLCALYEQIRAIRAAGLPEPNVLSYSGVPAAVVHGLQHFPLVFVVDPNGVLQTPSVTHVTQNRFTITAPGTGTALYF